MVARHLKKYALYIVLFIGINLAIYGYTEGFSGRKFHGQREAKPQAIQDFSLWDSNSHTFTPDDLQGRWTVLTFGYTSCVSDCPLTMAYFRSELRQLSAQDQVQFVFVSVDSNRDTLERLHNYVSHFHSRIRGVSGSPEQLIEFAAQFDTSFILSYDPLTEQYAVNHPVAYFLINPAGEWMATYTPPLRRGALAHDLKQFIELGKY